MRRAAEDRGHRCHAGRAFESLPGHQRFSVRLMAGLPVSSVGGTKPTAAKGFAVRPSRAISPTATTLAQVRHQSQRQCGGIRVFLVPLIGAEAPGISGPVITNLRTGRHPQAKVDRHSYRL